MAKRMPIKFTLKIMPISDENEENKRVLYDLNMLNNMM
jgi:hypothetical protein